MKEKLKVLWYFIKDGLLASVILIILGFVSLVVIGFDLAWVNILAGLGMGAISMLVYIKLAVGAGEAAYKKTNKLGIAKAKTTAYDKAVSYKWYHGILMTAVIYVPALIFTILAIALKSAILRIIACFAYLPFVTALLGMKAMSFGENYISLLYTLLPVILIYAAVYAVFYCLGARKQRLVYKMVDDDMREYGG